MTGGIGGLLAVDPGQLYGNPNTQDPAVQQAIANRGLLAAVGSFGRTAMPSRVAIPLGAVLGQAAGAAGEGEDAAIKARTEAAQGQLYGAQGQQALASIDAMRALIAKLSGTNLGKYMYGNQPLMGGQNPNQPGGGVSADGAGTAAMMSGPLGDKITYYAKYYGLDPSLFGAMINAESSGDPNAVSPKGAIGLGQVMPGNFAKYGVKNPYDVDQNLNASAHILADNLKLANGDTDLALRYYQGGTNQKAWGKDNEAYPALVRSRLPPPAGTPADQATVEPAYNPEKGQTQTAGGPGPAAPAAPAQPAAAPTAPPPPTGGGGGGPPAAASMETPEHAAWKQRVFEQMLGGPPAGPEPPAGGGLLAPQGAAASMPPPAAPAPPPGQGAALTPPPGAAQQVAAAQPGLLSRLASAINPIGSAQAAEAGPSATAVIPPRQPNLVAPPGGLLGPSGGFSPPNPGKNFYTPNSAPSVFAPNTGAPPPAPAPVAPPPVPQGAPPVAPTPPAAAPPPGVAPGAIRAPALPNVPLPLGPQDMNDIANMAMLADLAKFPTVGQMLMNSPAFKATVEGMSGRIAAQYKPTELRGGAGAGYPGGPMTFNPTMQEFFDPGSQRKYKAPWAPGMPTPSLPGTPGSQSIWSEPSPEEKKGGETRGEYTGTGIPGEPTVPRGTIQGAPEPDQPIPSPLNANRPYSSVIPPVAQQAHTPDIHTYGQAGPEWLKTSADISQAGATAQIAEHNLMMIAQAFKDTQTGMWATETAQLAQMFKNAGFTPPKSWGNLADIQTALHSNYRATLQQLAAANKRFTGNEFNVTSEAGEAPNIQPEANLNMISQDLGQLHQLQAFAGDWNQAQTMVASNGQHWVNPDSFRTAWMNQNPLGTYISGARDQIGKLAGMAGGPGTAAPNPNSPGATPRAVPPGIPAGSVPSRVLQDGRQVWRLPGGQEVVPSQGAR